MKQIALALVGILLLGGVAEAQVAVPIHTHIAIVGSLTGAITLLPARVRSLLGLQNDDASAVVYCTVDSTDASASNPGIRLNAAGGSVLLDTKVPHGALRCYSASNNVRVLIQEGR